MRIYVCLLVFILTHVSLYPQIYVGTTYEAKGHENVYFPLGEISFADSIVSFDKGIPRPLVRYQDPLKALGPPDYTGYNSQTFVSLGCGGSLVVKFNGNGFMNLKGDDLYIYEVGPSRESALVEISVDGEKWIEAGVIDGGKAALDLSDRGIDNETVFYYVRVTDLKDLCRGPSAGADIDAIGAINSVVKIAIYADVLFDVGKYAIKPEAEKILDSLILNINQFSKVDLVIEGHTDSDGGEEMNQVLSENRSLSVKNYLKSKLKRPEDYQYKVAGFGKLKPKVPNTSPENKQQNRRVEIIILPPDTYNNNNTLDKD